MKQYTVVLNIPCNVTQTFKCVKETVGEAITFAKTHVTIKSTENVDVNPYGHPEIFSITAHDIDNKEAEIEYLVPPSDIVPEGYQELVSQVANAAKETLHKHVCKCEKDPFYNLLKTNLISERVADAISNGDFAIINLDGVLNGKKYKIAIKLDEEEDGQ